MVVLKAEKQTDLFFYCVNSRVSFQFTPRSRVLSSINASKLGFLLSHVFSTDTVKADERKHTLFFLPACRG